MRFAHTLRKLLPGIWFGLLVAIAFIAMPAAFATLDHAAAGALARRIFSWEAPVSLVFGMLIVMIERRADVDRQQAESADDDASRDAPDEEDGAALTHPLLPPRRSPDWASRPIPAGLLLAAGALFCTVAGYYGLLPALEQARLGGPSRLSFLQLHALSLAFFGLKGLLVLALALKATR